jgi:hypothetical protein
MRPLVFSSSSSSFVLVLGLKCLWFRGREGGRRTTTKGKERELTANEIRALKVQSVEAVSSALVAFAESASPAANTTRQCVVANWTSCGANAPMGSRSGA